MFSDNATTNLLLVDDDMLLRRMAAKSLRHAGFVLSEAVDGEQALAQFAAQPSDLVLLDLEMPGLGGHEVCARLRATPAGARVPILILTGCNDTESIERAYQNGATDFITKPINWVLLSHRVRYALRASRAVAAAQRSEESKARAQQLAGLGSWAVTPDGHLQVSAELLRLYGVPAASHWTQHDFLAHVQEADRARVAAARSAMARQGTPYQIEFGVQREDGSRRRMFEQAAPVADEHGRARGFEGITQDITERVQAAERIRQLHCYDETTGLPNHRFFVELAAAALERARRNGSTCAVLHADVDRFVRVNDALGRAGGDAALKLMAQRLRSWLRGGDLVAVDAEATDHDVVARVGSNAFTLLIENLAGQEAAAAVARRLIDSIAQPIEVAGQSLVLTASIGIALFPTDAQDAAGLARCAEQALRVAKAAGRGQHRFFDEALNTRAASRLQREAALRHAIEVGQLCLYFQPKKDARSGAWTGAEALVRWQHPERGLVPPNEFIPLAEETGLIMPLTDWLLETACRQLRAWADAGLPCLPLSVNLAAPNLADPGLPDKLNTLTRRFDVPASWLVLEITETMLMRNVESVVARLQALRSQGYGVSLDDFGTGYSSLSYLKRFPIDELKIDRAFVTDVARGGRDGALATAIIALARGLELRVVAEGVETVEQSAFLLQQGCWLQQGYLFSRPLPAEAFEALLRAHAQQLEAVL
jgi:diguanylate cyclase (GGDEF)-like protein/PAS domain S-box-containing protein